MFIGEKFSQSVKKKIFFDLPTLLAKRASNHSPNLSPIPGKRLKQKSRKTLIFASFWYRGTRDLFSQ